MTNYNPSRRAAALGVATVVTAAVLLLLDLLWLGLIARPFYDAALGPLKRPVVLWPAAACFYGLYVVAIVSHAELGAASQPDAARRGAALGLVAYGTYELTNWAVLSGWPARLVLPDIAWGVALTAAAAVAGRAALTRMDTPARPDRLAAPVAARTPSPIQHQDPGSVPVLAPQAGGRDPRGAGQGEP